MTMRFGILAVFAAVAAAAAVAGHAQDAPEEARSALAPNAVFGATLFKQRCLMCHAVSAGQPNILGPNLTGVLGRKAAAAKFNYSPALRRSQITWDKARLDTYLAAPARLVPGTSMIIAVPSPKERADLVAYLAGLK